MSDNKTIELIEVWGWIDEWETERLRLLQHHADSAGDKTLLFDLGVNAFKNFMCRKLEDAEKVSD